MWDAIDTYEHVLELGLDGDQSGQLWPWAFYGRSDLLDVSAIWPSAGGSRLTAFAKRVDCDDLACFEEGSVSVVLIEGWTAGGKAYQRIATYPNFSTWREAASKGAVS